MKANKAITIALAGIVTACAIPFGTVFAAAEPTTDYPAETTDEGGKVIKPFERELELEDVTDYAVCGDKFAYASGLTITILAPDSSGDKKLTTYTHEYSVKKLDYDDKGELYFQNSSDISYLYASPIVRQEHEYKSIDSSRPIIVDEHSFYTLNGTNGELQFWKDSVPTSVGLGYSLIKQYGDYVYAIKDGTVPHKIDGENAEPLDLSYTDFDEASHILCADAAAKLASGGQLTTANIGSGKYYTQIDPDAIGKGETDTFKPKSNDGSTKKAEGDKPCLVLCKSGNTAVVATNEGMFITSTENLRKESKYSPPINDWQETHAYATATIGVYSSPFMSKSTKIADLESGSKHAVEVVERFELDFISTKFYKVKYETTDEESGLTKTVSGYVAANMLMPYDFKAEDNDPHENGDKDFKYDTNVVSVVLAIVIVALVIVAIMYISLIGTKKNKDKPEKKSAKKHRIEPVEDYNEDDE